VAAANPRRALRGAVLGLGMIGRHHARLLQASPEVDFTGAVDPGGDRFGAVHDPAKVFASIDELPDVDFAIVAVPTEGHLDAVRALSSRGAHLLVEKPLASTTAEAQELIGVVRDAGVRAAVGHVERFNPALLELRRRLDELGEVLLIRTERVGPFPDRVRDVGVVKDLGTHDLDLVRWLGRSPVASLAAQTGHVMGREHEDLVLVTGRLASGVTFSCNVDWISPTKIRRTRVLGARGMFEADTLTADLTLFRNGERATAPWLQQQRGVTEGDMTRFAIAKPEPLGVELQAVIAMARGEDSQVVTLEEGLETVRVAEAVLDSARSGETVRL
jgi:UDP-N-acetylglucosamine 3-dehydrogenase